MESKGSAGFSRRQKTWRLAQLEEISNHGRVALFDFDGTLTRRSTVSPLFKASLGFSRRYLQAVALAPYAAAYIAGVIDFEWLMRKSSNCLLVGMNRAALEEAGEQVAKELDRPNGMWPSSRSRFFEHVELGDAVGIVTGGHEFVAKAWLARNGLAEVRLFSSTLAWNSHASVESMSEVRVGASKLAVLEWARPLGRVVAYGNSIGDKELLEAADEAWWVDQRGSLAPFGAQLRGAKRAPRSAADR